MTPRNLGIRDKWIEMTERKGSETDSSKRRLGLLGVSLKAVGPII